MKTILIITTGVALLYFIALTASLGIKKAWAFYRWFLVFFLVGLFGLLTEWIMFHPAWFLRNTKLKILGWLWMDNSRFDKTGKLAEDYRIWLAKRSPFKIETWWLAYSWHMRNRVWNLLEAFKVPNGNPLIGNQFITITEFVTDKLYKNDDNHTKVAQDTEFVATAGLKYIPKNATDNIWQVNQGDIISIKTSILGTGFIFYKVGNWLSFRYSQCKIVNYGFAKYYRTIKLGTGATRYTFTIKHQKIKEWK